MSFFHGNNIILLHFFCGDYEVFMKVAGGPGFEPELLGPEPRVLPLNYPPNYNYHYHRD